jgi:hypothetical protein
MAFDTFPGSVPGQPWGQDLAEFSQRVKPQLPPCDLLVEGVSLVLGPLLRELCHFGYVADLS